MTEQPGREDPMITLCRWVVETGYDDIAPGTLAFAKKQILDILGVTMDGSKMDGVHEVVDFVREQGGSPESEILFHGGRVPAAMAAFAVAPMARAMDMGDTHFEAGQRPGLRSFMSRISVELDETSDPLGTRIVTRLKDGRRIAGEYTVEKGHPDNPLSVDEVVAKVRRCAPHAASPPADDVLEHVIGRILALEDVTDIAAEIIRPLTPVRRGDAAAAPALLGATRH